MGYVAPFVKGVEGRGRRVSGHQATYTERVDSQKRSRTAILTDRLRAVIQEVRFVVATLFPRPQTVSIVAIRLAAGAVARHPVLRVK